MIRRMQQRGSEAEPEVEVRKELVKYLLVLGRSCVQKKAVAQTGRHGSVIMLEVSPAMFHTYRK